MSLIIIPMARYKHAYAPDVRARANNAKTPGPGVIPNMKITMKNDIELLNDIPERKN